MKVVKGIRSDVLYGFKKINKDLNEGSSGAYVYACKKDGTSNLGVGYIGIARNREKCEDLQELGSEQKTNIKIQKITSRFKC